MQDGGNAVDNVQGMKVFDFFVVVARDDGEEVVEEVEDGCEAKQRHVQVHLDGDVLLVGVPEIQLLSLGDPDNQSNDSDHIDNRLCYFRTEFCRTLTAKRRK